MISPATAGAVGTILLLPGLFLWRKAEEISRFNERVDAIGSKRSWNEVEPAEWRVLATELLGICMTVVAVVGLTYAIADSLLG